MTVHRSGMCSNQTEASKIPPAPSSTALAGLVQSLVPHWRGTEIGSFEALPGGYSNRNYRFEHAGEAYVLRVPFGTRPYVDRWRELDFYRGSHRAHVPELIAADADSGTLLTRFEPGEMLAVDAVSPERLISYLRDLHDRLPASDHQYDPLALARAYLELGSPPPEILQLAERLEWAPTTIRACHNDLGPWNVLVSSSGRWITLDWEWFGANDPLFDLVNLHQGLGLPMSELTDLAAALLGTQPEPERIDRCLCVFWLREFAWAHAELARGNRQPGIERQLERTGAWLTGYLSPAGSSGRSR